MIDVNQTVREILNTVGVTVRFYHPDETTKLPIITYYELATSVGFAYDNSEAAQLSQVAVDIWAKSPKECAELAISADKAMQAQLWERKLSRDMPKDNGVYHKSMRFQKQIFFE